MASLRAVAVAAGLIGLLLVTVPLQVLLCMLTRGRVRWLPRLVFRTACRIIGMRCEVSGPVPQNGPAIIVANHISWLDIVAIGAHVPCHFIAKSDVAGWPVIGGLARLIGVLFVDRARRTAVAPFRQEMHERLKSGEILVLFPEGTSTVGDDVLPFRSALFPEAAREACSVHPLTVSYYGNSRDHSLYGWYGDLELLPHMWLVFKSGRFKVKLDFHAPLNPQNGDNRKLLAANSETMIREKLALARKGAKETSQIPTGP